MSWYSFVPPHCHYALPRVFDFEEYIQVEREMWAFFPETEGKRVNFCQVGLTAWLYVEASGEGELGPDETYFLMPCPDNTLRPLRMRAVRRLAIEEFRMVHLTAVRLAELLRSSARVLDEVHAHILGRHAFES